MKKLCNVSNCNKHVHGNGLCATHYARHLKGQDLNAPLKKGTPRHLKPFCKIENCQQKEWAKGLCSTHYARIRAYNDPNAFFAKRVANPVENRRAIKRKYKKSEKGKAAEARYRKKRVERGKSRLDNSKRRQLKMKATPNWLTEDHKREIERIYLTCPKYYHVDHIVPLKGKQVCGLHVPWNLAQIPAEENIRKNNKFELIKP